MRSPFIALAAAACLLCAGADARAQGNPSADQMIKSLMPTGALKPDTRGIRPSTGGTPAAAAPVGTAPSGTATAPPPVKSASAGAATKTASLNLSVQFRTGSAELTPQATRTLNELGRALSSNELSSYRFRIEGHTDNVGTAEGNKALSDRRAAAVAAYLESRFGIATARLETVGMGDTAPLVATPPQTAEPRNRRVQVVNLGG